MPQVQTVERVVEVLQMQAVLPILQVSVQEVVAPVPKAMVQEVVRQVPVPPVQRIEKVVEVPQVQAINGYAACPHWLACLARPHRLASIWLALIWLAKKSSLSLIGLLKEHYCPCAHLTRFISSARPSGVTIG